MAMICFPTRLSPFSSSSSSSTLFPSRSHPSRRAGVALVVFSSHSNPRILKSSRRSRTDRRTPSYDDEERVNEDSEEEEPSPDNDDLSDVGDQFNFQLTKQSEKTGRLKVLRKRQENGSLKIGQSLRNSYGSVKDDVKPILKKTNMTINHPILNRSSKELVDLEKYVKVLSLSLEGNLKPKYLYLVNELRNEVKSLTKYPMYLSLSLDQRIRPRHRFLVFLKKAPKGPFPLSSLVPTDECFCQQWAGTSLERYLAFRQGLQMTNFAKKYERKGL